MDMKTTSIEDLPEVKRLMARVKRAVSHAKKSVRDGNMTSNAARGYVIGRLDNLVREVNENRYWVEFDVIDRPWMYRIFAAFVGDVATYVGMKFDNQTSLEKANRILQMDLIDMENRACLPSGSVGFGSCRRCGRTLTNPTSVQRGIGPECIKKVGMDAARDAKRLDDRNETKQVFPSAHGNPVTISKFDDAYLFDGDQAGTHECKACRARLTYVKRFESLPCNVYCCGHCPYRNEKRCPKEMRFGSLVDNLITIQHPGSKKEDLDAMLPDSDPLDDVHQDVDGFLH